MSQRFFCRSAVLFAAALVLPFQAQACNDSPYLGTVCTFAFNYCPTGYMPADGRVLNVNAYSALYALLGNTYGGTPPNTFALPDLRGRVAVGSGAAPGLTPVNMGQTGGAESVALTANHLAAHTHAGGTVTGQTVTGSVTVNALNGDSAPTGGVTVPDGGHNTVGKLGMNALFYPPSASKPVTAPTSHNLAVAGGSVSVGANATTNTPVPVLNPRLGLTVCIATTGLWPTRE